MGKSLSRKPSGAPKALKLIVALVVGIALAAGGAAYFFQPSTPERTVAKFVAANHAGNAGAVKRLLAENSLKQWSHYESTFSTASSARRRAAPVTIGKATIVGTTATVVVTIGGDESDQTPYVCVNENGRWKLDIDLSHQAMAAMAATASK